MKLCPKMGYQAPQHRQEKRQLYCTCKRWRRLAVHNSLKALTFGQLQHHTSSNCLVDARAEMLEPPHDRCVHRNGRHTWSKPCCRRTTL